MKSNQDFKTAEATRAFLLGMELGRKAAITAKADPDNPKRAIIECTGRLAVNYYFRVLVNYYFRVLVEEG